jgi:hypothetical protein
MTERIAGSTVDKKDDRIIGVSAPKMDLLRETVDVTTSFLLIFIVLILAFFLIRRPLYRLFRRGIRKSNVQKYAENNALIYTIPCPIIPKQS